MVRLIQAKVRSVVGIGVVLALLGCGQSSTMDIQPVEAGVMDATGGLDASTDFGVDLGVDAGPTDTIAPTVRATLPRANTILTGSNPSVRIQFTEAMRQDDSVLVLQGDAIGTGEASASQGTVVWMEDATVAEVSFTARPSANVFIDVSGLSDIAGNRVVGSGVGETFPVTFRTE